MCFTTQVATLRQQLYMRSTLNRAGQDKRGVGASGRATAGTSAAAQPLQAPGAACIPSTGGKRKGGCLTMFQAHVAEAVSTLLGPNWGQPGQCSLQEAVLAVSCCSLCHPTVAPVRQARQGDSKPQDRRMTCRHACNMHSTCQLHLL